MNVSTDSRANDFYFLKKTEWWFILTKETKRTPRVLFN